MYPNSEVANALAVRCLCTANHMRSYLDHDFEMTEDVRHDLTVAVDLLETVCSEIEQSELQH
jgi:hypothetical protein